MTVILLCRSSCYRGILYFSLLFIRGGNLSIWDLFLDQLEFRLYSRCIQAVRELCIFVEIPIVVGVLLRSTLKVCLGNNVNMKLD